MKKLLSLLIAMLMIISVLPSVVFAEEDVDVQAVYKSLTAEMLTVDNEPESAITKSLNFDISEDLTLPEGVSVSFSSSDESVIAADGTVTRPLNDKKDVTITATISKEGAESLTKEFNYTVLPKVHEVIASDNLYYPEYEGKALVDYSSGKAVTTAPGWSLSSHNATIVASHYDAKFTQDENGYYGATGTRLEGQNECYLQYVPSGTPAVIQKADDKCVTYSLNFTPVTWGSTGTRQFYLRIYGIGKTGGSVMLSYIQFWNDRTRLVTPDTTASLLLQDFNKIKENENNSVQVKMDYNNKVYYLYLNGKLINPAGTYIPDVELSKQFYNLNLGYFRGMTDSVMQFNDVAVIRETKYQVNSVDSVTAEIIANGQDPKFVTENLNLPANPEFTWESSDETVITNDGQVLRPTTDDKEVTITVSDGASSKEIKLTVKALTTSGIGFNTSFVNPVYDSSLLALTPTGVTTKTQFGSAVYAEEDGNYYMNYTSTASFDNSEASLSIPTGTVFPVGSMGKYVIEFDICYTGVGHTLFGIMGNNVDLIHVNNNVGRVYTFNSKRDGSGQYWYGDGGTPDGSAEAGKWIPVKIVIDTISAVPSHEIYLDNKLIISEELAETAAFDESIGIFFRTRYETSDTNGGAKIDNLKVYTESTPDEAIKAMSNQDKAEYFAKFVTQGSITPGNSANLESDLTLDAPLKMFDLEEMGVKIEWSSSDPEIITNDGKVTKGEINKYVRMTAKITAGEGEDAVTVEKTFGFTVTADNSKILTVSGIPYDYTFESDTVGAVPYNWTENSSTTTVTSNHPGRTGQVAKINFTSTTGSAYTKGSYGGSLSNRYFVSADVCFEPDEKKTVYHFVFNGATFMTRVGFDFAKNGVSIMGDNTERVYMVPYTDIVPGEWYHIDIDYNAAKKTVMVYINGYAVSAQPLDLGDTPWVTSSPIRKVGVYGYGTGNAYLDNISIRESNTPAPTYDGDYTVRYMALTNQSGKTITNVIEDTTEVRAKVKLLQNKASVSEEVKIILARYDENNKLAGIVSETVETSNRGLVSSVKMPVDSSCLNHSFRIFVMGSGNAGPIAENLDTIAPKFDTEYLFDKDPNVVYAKDLGYFAESKREGIDAIIYDGTTYYGKDTKHFAYIGLPEGASAENPVPAVVCVHGGGGSAYDEWVELWNKAGYAAIAMNLNGRIPTPDITDGNNQLRHAWPGASQDNYATVSPNDATWMYSAVTAVIAAHNILRDMSEVDNSKIGITGVSWGGVVTSTTIGVDDRFAFAIPSYGCGYLYGCETYMATAMAFDEVLWDASNFIGNAKMPILWMNGDKDGNFSMTSTTKSILLAEENSYPAIIPGFGHSHASTWQRKEPINFADSIVKGAPEFIRGEAVQDGNTVTVTTNRDAVSCALHYTTYDYLQYDAGGTKALYDIIKIPASNSNASEFTFTLPSDAKMFFVTFKDEKSNETSTILYDVK